MHIFVSGFGISDEDKSVLVCSCLCTSNCQSCKQLINIQVGRLEVVLLNILLSGNLISGQAPRLGMPILLIVDVSHLDLWISCL